MRFVAVAQTATENLEIISRAVTSVSSVIVPVSGEVPNSTMTVFSVDVQPVTGSRETILEPVTSVSSVIVQEADGMMQTIEPCFGKLKNDQ